ncbi:HNH endonuclease [Gracilimonas sediminicola]|uniref:HNH endonuclease n=1 Tax=Gracilimonas sediminicola TaxID=2952158 RepID=UPI0038D502C5
MIYDFRKGDTAEYILEKLKASITGTSAFEIDPIKNIPHHEIEIKDRSFIHRKGENEFYMFAYKSKYQTEVYDSLPKYHITDCETRETYSGFRFANHMPVEIYCINQRKSLGAQHLELCKNCIREVNFYSMGNYDTDWFEVILAKANEREYTKYDLRSDGYTRDWGHVSKAYRYRKDFVCEECGIDLSEKRAEFFCEVHHIDRDKTNNQTKNLRCLCIRCHSKVDAVHEKNYSKNPNLTKLNQFKLLFPKSG